MKGTILKLKNLLSMVLLDNGWTRFCSTNVLVVRHDADCGYQYQGAAYSPIVDSIVEICSAEGLSVLSIATPYSRLSGAKAFNNPRVLNRKFFIVAVISRLIVPIAGKARSVQWAASRRAAIWRRVLERVKPRLVIGVQPDPYLCRASKALGIPVYDIQHGVIAADHWWYGKTLRNEVAEADLPTGFLCWDQPSAATLAEWAPQRGASVEVVGNPWFQRFRFPTENDHLVKEALQCGRIYSNGKPTLLVSLQWGLHIHYYRSSDFNKVMCKALESVIKRTHGKYNWLLRLHPVQLRGREGLYCEGYLTREFGEYAEVEWRQVSGLPLPTVLAQADLHITDMSTVVTEAAWLGVPSALLNPYLAEGDKLESLYQYERQAGLATLVPQQADQIEAWIEEKLGGGEVQRPDIPRDGVRDLLRKTMVMNG